MKRSASEPGLSCQTRGAAYLQVRLICRVYGIYTYIQEQLQGFVAEISAQQVRLNC